MKDQQCSEFCVHPFYCTLFATTPQDCNAALHNAANDAESAERPRRLAIKKLSRLSRQELAQLLHDASEELNSILEERFPELPEGKVIVDKQYLEALETLLAVSCRHSSEIQEFIHRNASRPLNTILNAKVVDVFTTRP